MKLLRDALAGALRQLAMDVEAQAAARERNAEPGIETAGVDDCRVITRLSPAAPRPGLTPEGASTTAISPARRQARKVPRGEEEKDGGATSPASEPAAKRWNGREVRMHTGKALARPNGFPRPAGAFPLRIVGGTTHRPALSR